VTRIEMIDFVGTLPYTSEGPPVQHSKCVQFKMSARLSRSTDGMTSQKPPMLAAVAVDPDGAAPCERERDAARLSRFDVRDARCAVCVDEDTLRSAIESCGAGVDAFNAWMHDMLVACVSPSKRTSLGRSQRGSKVTPMLPYSTPELHQLRDSRPIRD
jgi:hypothetical protein